MRDRECFPSLVRLGPDHMRLLLGLQSPVSAVGLAQRLVHAIGGIAVHRRYLVRVADGELDPNLTLTRTQYPAIVGNTGNRKPFTYAGFASPCNAQQPLTAHS